MLTFTAQLTSADLQEALGACLPSEALECLERDGDVLIIMRITTPICVRDEQPTHEVIELETEA